MDTFIPSQIMGTDTLPAAIFGIKDQGKTQGFPFSAGTKISETAILGWELCGTSLSFLYHLQYDGNCERVIKFRKSEIEKHLRARSVVKSIHCPSVLSVLEEGVFEGYPYEIYPLCENGSLSGNVLTESELKERVLPFLCDAVEVLHRKKILHNDIKPSNIFWDNSRKKILLGDFGSVSGFQGECISFSPEYAAPEVLYSERRKRGMESDCYSIGMTMLTLLNGKNPLQGMSYNQICLIHEEGFEWAGDFSAELKMLISGLLRKNPFSRKKIADIQKWCQGNTCILLEGKKEKNYEQRKIKPFVFIHVDSSTEYIMDISSLTKEIYKNWEYGKLIIEGREFREFLSQFGMEYLKTLEKCLQEFDKDNALFMTLQSLCPCKDFGWKGDIYEDLEDYTCFLSENLEHENAISFFQSGMLRFYLQQNGGTKEQLEFVKQLEDRAYRNKKLAVSQLLSGLFGENSFLFQAKKFENLEQLIQWVCNEADLDEITDYLINSDAFESWMIFLGYPGFVNSIKKQMERE